MSIPREIVKHIRLWARLVKMSLMSNMEYRVNFVTGLLMEGGYLIVKLLYSLIAYRAGRQIAGFGPDELLVFTGTFVIMTGFYAGFLGANLFALSGLVRDGSFDLILVKPVSTQFLASLRRADIAFFLLDLLAGLTMVVVGLIRLGNAFDPLRLLGYGFYMASGSLVGYALFLLPMTLVFKLLRADALAGLTDSFWDFNLVPMVAYNRLGQIIGVFVLPMFAISNFPSLCLLGRMPLVYMVWGLVAPAIFLTITHLAWKAGVKNYQSGNS